MSVAVIQQKYQKLSNFYKKNKFTKIEIYFDIFSTFSKKTAHFRPRHLKLSKNYKKNLKKKFFMSFPDLEKKIYYFLKIFAKKSLETKFDKSDITNQNSILLI